MVNKFRPYKFLSKIEKKREQELRMKIMKGSILPEESQEWQGYFRKEMEGLGKW